jgi:hypothetical protein
MSTRDLARLEEGNMRLIAQTLTAVLSATCRQFKPPRSPLPVKAAMRLGHAGFALPARSAATRALRVGRYRLKAVTER